MKVTLALTSLALCVSSALAGGIATVKITPRHAEAEIFDAYQDICQPIAIEPVDVEGIRIETIVSDETCTFYKETDCSGDKLTRKEGDHTFSRTFLVGSFMCDVGEF